MLERLARFCFRQRWLVLAIWVAAFVVLGALQGVLGPAFRTEFSLPGTESQDGFAIIEKSFGGGSTGFSGTVVFRADAGVEDPAVKTAMEGFFAKIGTIDEIAPDGPDLRVTSPYSPAGQQQIAQSGDLAFAEVEFLGVPSQADLLTIGNAVKDDLPEVAGLQVELGGQAFAEFAPPESEVIGLGFAIFILLIAFGSVLAMGLPVGTALFGIGTGVGIVTVLSHAVSMPDFTTVLAAMIGLGVGIDYALFIVTRYREGLHAGMSPEAATVVAIGTAGRAVIFAGITVVISLLGMLLMGLSFVNGLAIGASITVAMTMLASITLLPALLGFAKHRVEVTRWRGLGAVVFLALALFGVGLKLPPVAMVFLALAAICVVLGLFLPALKREVPRRAVKPMRETFWFRWSRLVQHRPWPMFLLGVVILAVLSVPVFSLRLGFSDEGNYPEETTTRKAYDLLAQGFGQGSNGPLILASNLSSPADLEAAQALSAALGKTEGVAFASPGIPNDPANPTAVLWRVIPTSAPQDEATSDLVQRLRDDVVPAAVAGTGLDPKVTGIVAANNDFADYLAGRLPLFFGAVLALSFLLLMAVFRSVFVPIKAVVMNLLSIGASYGVVVAVFQWGWAKELFGLGKGGPIEAWAPMMMFAIVFGLSMDYEVFLLSRMREEFLRTGDNATAVADGLAATARVITAAAAIMVFVFGSFLLEPDRQIKLFGTGLAMAVLLDATVVRMILVPATMELLGARNWWLPGWLDKLLPKLDVEGHHDALPEAVPTG